MLKGVGASELASIERALQAAHSGSPSSATSPSPNIPPDAGFRTALATAKDGASSPSPNSYFDLVPPEPTFVGPGLTTLWPSFGWQGSTNLGPTFVWPGGAVAGPVSSNKAGGPKEPEPGNEPPPNASAAEQAQFYAGVAKIYADGTTLIEKNTIALARTVEYRARPDQSAQVETARGAAVKAASAAEQAELAADDAQLAADSAAEAEAEGDPAQAAADAAFAKDCAVSAEANQTTASGAYDTALAALNDLNTPGP